MNSYFGVLTPRKKKFRQLSYVITNSAGISVGIVRQLKRAKDIVKCANLDGRNLEQSDFYNYCTKEKTC